MASLAAAGCFDGGASKTQAGYVTTEDGPFGPAVVFDPLRLPVPDVPFPSDLLLRPSDSTFSGKAWNMSPEAPTDVERRVRARLNTLDGFGLYSPIYVRFDAPLDLTTITDETVLLVNIQEGSAHQGETVPLDLGKGYFPVDRPLPPFWGQDPMADVQNLLFAEDNTADLDGDGVEERLVHYEKATHSLIIRPVLPLEAGSTYAVLLTRGLEGEAVDAEGNPIMAPVRSPFPYKAHAAQAPLVRDALDLLGMDDADLAFGWTFTTSDPSKPLLSYRDGLYGRGPLKRMAEMFPAKLADVADMTVTVDGDWDQDGVPEVPRDHRFILQPKLLLDIFGLIGPQAFGDFELPDFKAVDYLVFGFFDSPDMRTGDHKTFGVDAYTGEGEMGTTRLPFFLSIPKETPEHKPPFPVMLYFHGTATSRVEVLLLLDALSRQGIAALSFDQVGHGPIIPSIPLALEKAGIDPSLVQTLLPIIIDLLIPEQAADYEGLEWHAAIKKLEEVGLWRQLAVEGRTEDENGNGALESSEGFFFADPFRMCASFWQDMVDLFQIVRILRNLDPAAVPPAIDEPYKADPARLMQNLLAGDFNADGVLDLGGPDVQLSVAGTSLGGFHATLGAALEPEITVATPIVAGGGFGDIMGRSNQRDQSQWIFLETFGPLVVGCPDGQGGVWLSWNDDADRCKESLLTTTGFAHVPDMAPGTLVTARNLANGEAQATLVNEQGGFSVAVASDRWDPLEVTIRRPDGSKVVVPGRTPYEGTAFQRNTPRFRRFINIATQVLDRCDPIAFAPNLFLEPLPGHPPTKVLFENAVGDRTVPISTGVMLALASGVFGTEPEQWQPITKTLIDHGFMKGSIDYDPDDLWGDNALPEDAPIGPLEPVPAGDGVASIRFANVRGKHEWIAQYSLPVPSQGEDFVFDAATYNQNQVVLFHALGGKVVVDDLCIEELSCPILDDPEALLVP
ncbi:MAG: hypothetical protein H6744_13000 [Deltaproteobacteria bacterium]|nr:hypothetical protein [Deltaproteobacteria bacterium]